MELYHSPGSEADDVLAAMADQCLGSGARVVIASNDFNWLCCLTQVGVG